MDFHEIRLRGGWEVAPADGVGPAATRLTLPARGNSLPAGRLRLTRRFNRPPRIADEPVKLRLRNVPGMESVLLNGLPIGPISPDCPEFDLEVGPLELRNELVIVADAPRLVVDWGEISLVFGGASSHARDEPTLPLRP